MNSNPEEQSFDLLPKLKQALFMNIMPPQELPDNWLMREHEKPNMFFPLDVGQFTNLAEEAQELSAQLDPGAIEVAQKIAEKTIAGFPGRKDKVESIISKVKFPATFDLLKPFRKIELKTKIFKLASLLTILSILLVACASTTAANGELPSVQPTVITQFDGGTDTEQPIGQESTPVPLESIDVDYGRYEGNESQVDPILERAWTIISENILSRDLAVPAAIEVVDVSDTNVIVEILPQGRPDDYPAGTHFTISHVDGHDGELLAITTEGANSVLGNFRAVELAISVDQLPVALDAHGNPVAHVDKETGQWLAGGAALATDPVAEAEQMDLLNTPINEVAQMLAEGEIEYPSDWEDSKKTELAIAFAEYLNSITADEAYVSMHFDEVGDIQVGWDPVTKRWRSSHNAAEAIDITGNNLPELVVAGYTNSAGQEVIIDSETGAQKVLSEIDMPGLGPTSITELYAMGSNKLQNYIAEKMLGAGGLDNIAREFIESIRNNHFSLPVYLDKSNSANEHIYSFLARNASSNQVAVPEAKVGFLDLPTNSVLMPIVDKSSGNVILWLRIQQGIQFSNTNSFSFSPGTNPSWDYLRQRDNQLFGNNSNHSFGILMPGKTTSDTYRIHGEESFLENGTGIGSEADLLQIINTKDIVELVRLLVKLRLIVLYPDVEMHQN